MNQECYKVIVKDGKQFLTYKGEILPNQIEIHVVQDMEHVYANRSLCTVSIKCLATLEETIEQNE